MERLSQDLKQAFPDIKGFSPLCGSLARGDGCAADCCTNSLVS
ncbi:MAG: hypothetical protein JO182_24635 [Acidobacteriaceae bacterium]|nr:hypothetical protein [Acidobacteriaceae bacterium]MBV9223915.1 hypothetical protein [Acidobacteriaceae bacterium]MBV9305057.1 hypothetical protein [Acidobacteriaceae bacterium]MBV9679103.1 hypothetical protein [Acidobacteriaceae bacterium]MBV9939942.1 hypothetical protein [Acidobacteriaceae bacterium]